MKALKLSEVYFSELPKSTQTIVKDLIIDAAQNRKGPEGWKSDDDCLSEIECIRRDGFIPFAHNRGGIVYRNFTDLMGYYGGGYGCAHEKADAEIERLIDYSFECVAEQLVDEIGKEDFERYFDSDLSKLTYANLEELRTTLEKQGQNESVEKVSQWSSQFQNLEYENLGGDSTIMHEFRFMYHGCENSAHTASVSAAINTEGPYHRSSISWSPSTFCEGAKEIEISWKTNAELKRKLKAALEKCSKAIF